MLTMLSPARLPILLLALVPAVALQAAPPVGRPARYTRQLQIEPAEEMPAEEMPEERPRTQRQPVEPMEAEPMPVDELPSKPRAPSRTQPRAATPRSSVIVPYENERIVGDLGGYAPETGRRHGICYPQTGACGAACGCCYPCYTWGSIDFVLMWRKGQNYPPLVTTSPIGTPDNVAGVLGLNTTSVLFGGETIGSDVAPGGRADVGLWLNQCQVVGLGARFLGLGDDRTSYSVDSSQNPIIAVPIFNLLGGTEDALIAAHPDRGTGSVNFNSRATAYAGDAYLRFKFWEDQVHRMDLISGYTFAKVEEQFTLDLDNSNPLLGQRMQTHDAFLLTNRFEGVSLGALYTVRTDCWTIKMLGKCALGGMRHVANISGNTTETIFGGPVTVSNGGIFAQPTNIGRYQQSELAIMPEAEIKLGYRICQGLEVTVGYNAIYFNRMAQAGNQIDRTINDSQFNGGVLAGPPRPEFAWHLSDYWVQGVTMGIQGTF